MKTRIILMLFLSMALNTALSAEKSSRVTVNFDSPEKFTDFQSSENRSSKDQKRLMVQLQKMIDKSVEKKLAKDAQLKITVKDVDMPGRFIYPGGSIDLRMNINNNNTQAVRVVKDADRALFDFDYELIDKNGKVQKQGHEVLSSRNLNFSARSKLKYQQGNFEYIMPMFDTWLGKL
jgi:hypothetical protein